MMASDMAIDVQQLAKHYRRKAEPALDGVTFSIAPGASVGLLGPNGAGKTTLIKLLCGVIPPSSGTVRVLGRDPYRDGFVAKRAVGVVHQDATFDQFLTPVDNLKIAAAFFGLKWSAIKVRVDELIEVFQIGGCLGQPVFTLSGGQMRRLQVIRALLKQPRLLILDEPSAGLDVAGRHVVWELLHSIRREQGVTILWSSHYVEELERNCERVLVIKQGRLLCSEPVDRLLAQFGSPRIVLAFPEPPAASVVDALRDLAALHVRQEGERLEILDYVSNPLTTVLATLQRLNCMPSEIKIVPGSLEDAYLALVEGQSYGANRRLGLTPAGVPAAD